MTNDSEDDINKYFQPGILTVSQLHTIKKELPNPDNYPHGYFNYKIAITDNGEKYSRISELPLPQDYKSIVYTFFKVKIGGGDTKGWQFHGTVIED